MKQRGKYLKQNIQRFSWDVAASSFLVIFFSFFLIYAQASELATPDLENCETINNPGALSGAHLFADHNHLVHFPLGSIPAPPESETKDERETNDQSDEDAGKSFATLLSERFGLTSRKCLLLQLLQARENRKEVSLFVLHHSWKSFLG